MNCNENIDSLRECLDRRERYMEKMQRLVTQIDSQKADITDLKREVKSQQEELEELQSRLIELVRNGVDEQRMLPLMDSSEPMEESNADDWKSFPVSALSGLTEKEIEKLTAEFETCGEVCEWIGSDFSRKVSGIGDKTREKIQIAIDKIAGVTDESVRAEAERGKKERESAPMMTLDQAETILCDMKLKYFKNFESGWDIEKDTSGSGSNFNMERHLELVNKNVFTTTSIEHCLLFSILSHSPNVTNDMVMFEEACWVVTGMEA